MDRVLLGMSHEDGISNEVDINFHYELFNPNSVCYETNCYEEEKTESAACQCLRALSGESGYEKLKGKCRKMYICWYNAQIDCMMGTSTIFTKCNR